jgi:hypothetical protein
MDGLREIVYIETFYENLSMNSKFSFLVVAVGPIRTAAFKAYCTLTPTNEFRHSTPEALHTKRRERPLLAKDVTKTKE